MIAGVRCDSNGAAVAADYATRWPDLTAPTLAECQSFVAGCEIVEPAPATVDMTL